MNRCFSMVLIAGCVGLIGCSDGAGKPRASGPDSPPVDGSPFLLDSVPPNVAQVVDIRAGAKDQDEVVVVGRIGGSETPWVEGRAAFSIVDVSLKSCDDIGSDGCPKPWDFC